MAYVTDIRVPGFSIVDRLNALRADLALRARKNRAYRKTLNELSAMSARELADIGINRSMISEISRAAAEEIN